MTITPFIITTIVCDVTECPYHLLVSRSRKRMYVQARQISAYLIWNEFSTRETPEKRMSLKKIADILGLCNHATVIHSKTAVENEMQTNNDFWMLVKTIEERIEEVKNTEQNFAVAV